MQKSPGGFRQHQYWRPRNANKQMMTRVRGVTVLLPQTVIITTTKNLIELFRNERESGLSDTLGYIATWLGDDAIDLMLWTFDSFEYYYYGLYFTDETDLACTHALFGAQI